MGMVSCYSTNEFTEPNRLDAPLSSVVPPLCRVLTYVNLNNVVQEKSGHPDDNTYIIKWIIYSLIPLSLNDCMFPSEDNWTVSRQAHGDWLIAF